MPSCQFHFHGRLTGRKAACPTRPATGPRPLPSHGGPGGREMADRPPRCPSAGSGRRQSPPGTSMRCLPPDRPSTDGEEAVEHFGAIAVYVADGGPDLGVAVAVQRLLDEIDEAGLALQCCQERDRLAAGRLRRLLGWPGLGTVLSGIFACGFAPPSLFFIFPFLRILTACHTTNSRNKTATMVASTSHTWSMGIKPFFRYFVFRDS